MLKKMIYIFLSLIAFPCSSFSTSKPEVKPETLMAKGYDWVSFIDYNFPLKNEDWQHSSKSDIRTDAVVVMNKGQIVFEKYGRGYTADSKHLLWSTSKSFLAALVGIAISEKKLKLEDSLCLYYPNYKNCSKITVKNLVEWSSGLKWNEVYEGNISNSSVATMLYKTGHKDMVDFVLNHEMSESSEKVWRYSSGDSNILSGVLKKALGAEYDEYPWKKILNPLEIKDATFERDQTGLYIGASYLYLTAKDLSKFGQLYLNKGQWNGKQIVPEKWINYSLEVLETFKNHPIYTNPVDMPGAHLWTNKVSPYTGQRPWPSAPEDMFLTRGHWGQFVFVIPSLNVVIVRFGDSRKRGAFDVDHFLKLALTALKAPESKPVVLDSAKKIELQNSLKNILQSGFDPNLLYKDNTIFRLGPSYMAKEICSCFFVEHQSAEFCKRKYDDVSKWLLPVDIDQEFKTVTAAYLYLFLKEKAIFQNDRWGCQLQ